MRSLVFGLKKRVKWMNNQRSGVPGSTLVFCVSKMAGKMRCFRPFGCVQGPEQLRLKFLNDVLNTGVGESSQNLGEGVLGQSRSLKRWDFSVGARRILILMGEFISHTRNGHFKNVRSTSFGMVFSSAKLVENRGLTPCSARTPNGNISG